MPVLFIRREVLQDEIAAMFSLALKVVPQPAELRPLLRIDGRHASRRQAVAEQHGPAQLGDGHAPRPSACRQTDSGVAARAVSVSVLGFPYDSHLHHLQPRRRRLQGGAASEARWGDRLTSAAKLSVPPHHRIYYPPIFLPPLTKRRLPF